MCRAAGGGGCQEQAGGHTDTHTVSCLQGCPGALSDGWAGARGSFEHGERCGCTGHLLPSSSAGLTRATLAPAPPLHRLPLLSGWTNGTRTQREVGVPWNSLGEAGDGPQEGTSTRGGKLLAVQVQSSFPPGDFGTFHVAISNQGVAWSRVVSGCPI